MRVTIDTGSYGASRRNKLGYSIFSVFLAIKEVCALAALASNYIVATLIQFKKNMMIISNRFLVRTAKGQ